MACRVCKNAANKALTIRCLKLGLLIYLMHLFVFIASGYAEQGTVKAGSKTKAVEKNEAPTKNIILLIDSSGSMKRTDPKNYRKPAAKLFVSLLGEDVRLSVVSFGDTVKTLLPLSVNKRSQRPLIDRAIDQITSKEYSTHIHLAIKKGLEILKETKEGSGILVLMSDGKLTLGSTEKDEAAMAELLKLLPEAAKLGIKIYTIPFTEESDIKLLEKIAADTGAFSRLAKQDTDIHKIFASIFEKIRQPDAVPITEDGFVIDSEIKEAILLITKQPKTRTTLLTPAGTKITAERKGKDIIWHNAEVFDMITIPNPEPGRWKVNLSTKEGNRVYVLTNLRLKSNFNKNTVHKGETLKIDAWLERDGGVVTEQDVLSKITFILDSLDPMKRTYQTKMILDSLDSGVVPSGGRYIAETKIESIGDYTLRIIAEGNTFKREKVLEFKAEDVPQEKSVPTKIPQQPEPVKEEPMKWSQAIIIFGAFNGILILIGGAVFLIMKFLRKRNKKK